MGLERLLGVEAALLLKVVATARQVLNILAKAAFGFQKFTTMNGAIYLLTFLPDLHPFPGLHPSLQSTRTPLMILSQNLFENVLVVIMILRPATAWQQTATQTPRMATAHSADTRTVRQLLSNLPTGLTMQTKMVTKMRVLR